MCIYILWWQNAVASASKHYIVNIPSHANNVMSVFLWDFTSEAAQPVWLQVAMEDTEVPYDLAPWQHIFGFNWLIDVDWLIQLLCMCWFMWACRSRHHYNESSAGLVCTWRRYKAVPCLYCFGLRDVNTRWKKISKWNGKILALFKCNLMAFGFIMVCVCVL